MENIVFLSLITLWSILFLICVIVLIFYCVRVYKNQSNNAEPTYTRANAFLEVKGGRAVFFCRQAYT